MSEASWQLRHALFEGHEQRRRRARAMERVEECLARLAGDPESFERPALMAELVATPFALIGHISARLAEQDEAWRMAALEVLTRRFHRNHPLGQRCTLLLDGRPLLLLQGDDRRGRKPPRW